MASSAASHDGWLIKVPTLIHGDESAPPSVEHYAVWDPDPIAACMSVQHRAQLTGDQVPETVKQLSADELQVYGLAQPGDVRLVR